jgi:hypothetical protein
MSFVMVVTLLAAKQQHPVSHRNEGVEVEIQKCFPEIQAANLGKRCQEILPYLWDQDVLCVSVRDPGDEHD